MCSKGTPDQRRFISNTSWTFATLLKENIIKSLYLLVFLLKSTTTDRYFCLSRLHRAPERISDFKIQAKMKTESAKEANKFPCNHMTFS